MKPVLKKLAYTAVALAASAGLATLFVPEPLPVDTTTVTRGALQVTIDEDGETRAHDRYEVSAPVAGRVARIELHEGDPVGEGQLVAELRPLPLSARERAEQLAQIAGAEARHREADAQASQIEAELERLRQERLRADTLSTGGFVSPQALEQARLAEAATEKALAAAQFHQRAAAAELRAARAARLALDSRAGSAAAVKLRSPAKGYALRIPERSERVVAAGEPLVTIGDPSALEVVVDVLSSEAVRLRPGMTVLLGGWGGPEQLHGRVRVVEPYAFTKTSALGVEEQRVNVIADLLDPPGALGDGYRVEARFVVWEDEDVLKIPGSALFRLGDGWATFVVADGRARLRRLDIGQRGGSEAEIRSGLEAGEIVIVHPANDIEDGSRVTVRSGAGR